MNKKEKKLLTGLTIVAIGLGSIAAVGLAFCSYAGILLAPALLPITVYAINKLTKTNKLNFSKK